MIRWAAAMLTLFCTSLAVSDPWHYYIGAGGQWQSVGSHIFRVPVYADTHLDGEWTAPYFDHWSGFGGQIEGGIAHDRWSVGLGFSHLTSRNRESHSFGMGAGYSRWEQAEWLASDRLLLGIRLHASERDPNPLKPTIGIGCSWGWMSWTSDYTNVSYYNGQTQWDVRDHTTQRSKGVLGVACELGMTVHVNHVLSASCLGRLDGYNVNLDGGQKGAWRYGVPFDDGTWIAALQLGLQYHFRRNSGQ